MDSPLQITVLGKPQIMWQRQPLSADLISAKGQALLVYLAVTGQTHSRQSISGLLWGDLSDERARGNLRLALSKLRGVVGDYVIATRHSLAFDFSLPYSLDASEFIRHCAAPANSEPSQLETALDLYHADFLDDFHLHDAPDFETWVVVERERFQQMAVASLMHLAVCAQDRNELDKAISFTRRILALEPWREDGHSRLMTLLAQSGQRTVALNQFEVCRKHLDEELGVEPSAETKALYDRIKQGDVQQADGELKARSWPSPQKSALDLRHNLPQQPMPFLGREDELTSIAELLAKPECHLLTLVGPGGVGKTRLSIRAARLQVENFQDGVRFLSLRGMKAADPIETIELLIAAMADAVGYTFSAKRSPRELLIGHLADKEILLLLDNFEPLLSSRFGMRKHTERLLLDILERCSAVRILVTSRERIDISSEFLLEVRGLEYPPTFERNATPRYPSVELFIRQARRVDPGFSLEGQEYAVNRICQLVSGFPLGIELAANWVRLLPCAEIVERLERGGEILTTELPESNPSLRSVLDSTWAMLTEREQDVFRRLSVFREGFTLSAAQQVADASLPVLNSLMNKSMLRRVENGRFVLHELLKQFGSYHLNLSPEQEKQTRQKHGRLYGSFLQSRRAALKDPFNESALPAIDAEIENIRAALELYFEQGDGMALDLFIECLFYYLQRKGWFQEAVFILEQACALEQISTVQKGYWHQWLGRVYFSLGNFSASARNIEQGLGFWGYPIPSNSIGLSLGMAGNILRHVVRRIFKIHPSTLDFKEAQKRLEAVRSCDTLLLISWFQSHFTRMNYMNLLALHLAETVDTSPELALVYANMAIGVHLLSQPALSGYYIHEAKKIAQQQENRIALAWVLETSSIVYIMRGENWERVEKDLETASDIFRKIQESRRWEQTEGLLGEFFHLQGRYAESQAIQKETLASARQRGDNQFQFHELAGLAANAMRMGNRAQSLEFLNEASVYLGENKDMVEEIRFYGLSAQVHVQEGDMGAAKQFARLAAERIAKVSPMAFYTLEGYAGVSEVYLTELENGLDNESLKSARRAVKSLNQFGRVLPVGQARAWTHQGLLHWAEGLKKKALAAWEKSLRLAEQMSLPYEAARAHYEIGRHLDRGAPTRRIHLEKAIEIFSELGLRHELTRCFASMTASNSLDQDDHAKNRIQ